MRPYASTPAGLCQAVSSSAGCPPRAWFADLGLSGGGLELSGGLGYRSLRGGNHA